MKHIHNLISDFAQNQLFFFYLKVTNKNLPVTNQVCPIKLVSF